MIIRQIPRGGRVCVDSVASGRPALLPLATSRFGHQRRQKSGSTDEDAEPEAEHQANALGGFYQVLLEQAPQQAAPASRTRPTPLPPTQLPTTDREERLAKARVVFGSRLAGPTRRRSEMERASTRIAGVLVPRRPSEPDNCCMSGCVNCVWDRYRDELEDWAAQAGKARAALARARGRGQGTGPMVEGAGGGAVAGAGVAGAAHTAVSMGDDGGGSETNWGTGLGGMAPGEDLFKGVPVGILEFMRTEKRLKERHRREGSVGG
ncbi:MAG: hypothetical protein M1832_004332 [Thelocarpon impressellum]|nr:MAG: hypothetical protein M1832_004332 [Thelocarpon impressellum]